MIRTTKDCGRRTAVTTPLCIRRRRIITLINRYLCHHCYQNPYQYHWFGLLIVISSSTIQEGQLCLHPMALYLDLDISNCSILFNIAAVLEPKMDTEQTLTFHLFPLFRVFPPNFFRLQHNNPLFRLMIHYSYVRTTPTSQRCALFLFLGKKRPLTGISWVKNDFFPVFHRDVCDDDHRGRARLAWKHLLRLCSRKVGLSFNRELVRSHF